LTGKKEFFNLVKITKNGVICLFAENYNLGAAAAETEELVGI
jgi:hypothetical protein